MGNEAIYWDGLIAAKESNNGITVIKVKSNQFKIVFQMYCSHSWLFVQNATKNIACHSVS